MRVDNGNSLGTMQRLFLKITVAALPLEEDLMKHFLAALLIVTFALGCDGQPQEQATASHPDLPVEAASVPQLDKPMLPAYKLPGDMRPLKADQYDDYRDAHPELYAITEAPTVAVRPVAEYEDAGRLMITISTWGLPAGIRQNFVDIVKAGKNVVDVYVVYDGASVKSSFTSALSGAGVASNAVTWVNMDLDSIWTRDYGPTPITSLSGKVGMVDNRYYHQRIYDDAVPTKLGSLWNTSVFRSPLDFEGGNFMADTAGNCFCSEGVLMYNGVSESQLKTYFEDYYGCTSFHIMKTLANEGTTHIDMQMKLVNDQTVLVGEYGANQDYQNYLVTNQNAAYFEGLGYEVVRMPMPSNSDGAFRTFINSLFVNGVNMVPVYSIDKTKEAQAMAIWKQVMPTWQHVPMNADDVIQWAGAIHCITMTTAGGSFSKMQTDPEYACNGDWDCYPGSGSAGCDGLTYQGCCDGNLLKYCDGNQLKTINCGNNPQCGWKADAGYYDCSTNGGSDPSGKYPKDCDGGCVPACGGKECGSDGCGGSCGSCSGNETCQAGQCVPQAENCDGLTYEGCCDGNILKYCDDKQIATIDCTNNQKCGWHTQNKFYDCGTDGGADPSGAYPKDCDGGCVPQCGGMECGDNGCGGSCGSCPAGETCQAGQCKGGCTPNCNGKECGGDGCGGSCGTCAAGQSCQAGVCVGESGCGDVTYAGFCDGENLVWCENDQVNSADCSKLDGNYKCEFWADGDGYYCVKKDECVPDCAGLACGDDGCGGSCGSCADGESCQNGVCIPGACEPDCFGKACGSDGCSGVCGTCPDGSYCKSGHCADECKPDCAGFECGSDGCGGSCGVCPAGFSCEASVCVQGCTPHCTGKECGDDSCGGFCGSCPAGNVCQGGQCSPDCVPACADVECGADGCGGSCGSCPKDYTCDHGSCTASPDGCGNVTSVGQCDGDVLNKCVSNQVISVNCSDTAKVCSFVPNAGVFDCVSDCIPNCGGKACGDDGCDGTCGSCLKGESCDNGQCIPDEVTCVPACQGLECGDDGCGGSCGACAAGLSCATGVCTEDAPISEDVVVDATPEEDIGSTGGGSKSGGCTTTATGGPSSALLLLMLGLALLWLRRSALVLR